VRHGADTLRAVVTLAVLAAATILLRLPFLTPRLAHWDAVNYALGLHDFNVAAHQPHPPGSPYFILLGRAVLALVGDDNSALILVALLGSVGAVLSEYVLVRLLFGPRAAVVAALVLMTQPIFWGYGSMGDAWTVLALLSLAIGLLCALLVRGHRRLVFPSAVVMGLASGFRLDATLFLAPLWLWALMRAEPDWRRRAAAIALVAAGVLIWLVPVATSAGGVSAWSNRLLALLPSPDLTPESRLRQFEANTLITSGTLALTIGPALALSLISDWRGTRSWISGVFRCRMGVFWVLWIVPAFAFLWIVDSTEPGHDLVFAVALVALVAALLAATARTVRRLAVCGTLVVAVQAAVFLLAAPLDGRPLAWTADTMLLNVTAPGLREQQISLDSTLRIVRSRFAPGESVLVTLVGQDPYRFLMYYLPEYTVVRLDTHIGTVLAARGRHQGNLTQPTDCLFASVLDPVTTVRHAVWVVATRSEPGVLPEDAVRIDPPDSTGPYQVWDLQPGFATPDYLGFRLGGQCGAG
jgi:4-amino-4-deoxy-L-arabinose transferase-like glycosyltransferase